MIGKKLSYLVAGTILLLLQAGAAHAAPEAADLVPPPVAMPAPTWFIKILQAATFYLHLVLVNIVLGLTLLTVLDSGAPGPRREIEGAFLPKMLSLTVNFAIAPLLFLQVMYGNFMYPSIMLMAVWWMAIFILVMLAYYGLYVAEEAVRPARQRPVMAISVALMLLTAFLLTNVSSLTQDPSRWFGWFAEPYGTFLNLGDPTLLPRYLHNIASSLAVGGLATAWCARLSKNRPGADANATEQRIRRGLDWFFSISLAQIPVGLWYLFSLPAPVRRLFLGAGVPHTLVLVLSLAGLAAALFLARRGGLKPVTALLLGIILAMVCARSLLREAMLQPYSDAVAAAETQLAMPHGQNEVIMLFLACLILGVAATAWLVRILFRVFRRPGDSGTYSGPQLTTRQEER